MTATRRAFLAAGAGAAAALAGCAGGGTTTDAPTGTTAGTATDGGGGGLPDHPALAAVEAQPALGDLSRPGVIVAFEDPSCPLCRRFEENAYPRIVSELVEPGKAAFVFRGYPVVYPWGDPASHALEATYDADPGAFWGLKDFYFSVQADLGTDNVLDRTESYLAENTDGDAASVVAAVEEGSYDAAVGTDLDAGEEAGASGTPAFFLFRDGEFRTGITGPQGYDVFAGALGF